MHRLPGCQSCSYFGRRFLFSTAFALVLFVSLGALRSHAAAPVVTTTTLAASSTSLNQGTTLTLTARVSDAGGNPVTAGAVKFCVASATRCDDITLLGMVQLVSAGSESGTAVLRIRLGAGSHSIRASFAGTSAASASNSEAQTITVTRTGTLPSQAAISSSGVAGNYTLTGTVMAAGSTLPTGSFRFLDKSNSNYVLGTATITAPTRGLGNGRSFAAGQNPLWVSTGDFNEDGIPDFVVANMTTTNLSVMLGDGSGSFAAAPGSPIVAGNRPKSIAVGDFNADSHQDLVVPHDSDDNVMVLLGDGKGQFSQAAGSPYALTIQRGADTAVVADFNRDGNLDWAVLAFGGEINVGLGDGAGGFALRLHVADANIGGVRLEVGDFNNDGNPDLLATNRIDNLVRVFLGDGTGAFSLSPGSPYSLGPTAEAGCVVADFNDDGFADFAVLHDALDNVSDDGKVSVMLGDGAGNFTPASNSPFPVPGYNKAVRVADFNGDGIKDVVVAGISVEILHGDGHGSFLPPVRVGDFYYSFWIDTADFNGDGLTDVVAANFFTNGADVLLGQLTGTAVLSHVSVPGPSAYHSVVAEYSGDSNYQPGTSASIPLASTRIPTTVTLTTEPAAASNQGQLVTLTAALSPVSLANYTAGGRITFNDGSNTLCSSVSVDNKGTAVCTATSLSAGTHSFSAVYAGDGTFAPSTSEPRAFTINSTAITLSAATSSLTLKQGQKGTVSLTARSTGTVTGKVTFGCEGLPVGASCSFSSSTVDAGSLPKTISVTVKTSLRRGAPLAATVLFMGLLLPAGALRSRRRVKTALVALAAVLVLCLVACGDGNPKASTPSGNYHVVITATANGTTQGWATINLTVTE